jgi:predicted nuclease of predicted toxin-antitoxin system
MKVVKLVIDMNLSPTWVDFLRATGPEHLRELAKRWPDPPQLESVHWSQVGDPRATDSTVLQWARERGYVVFTQDLDFSALIARTRAEGPSVLQVRTQDVLPAAIGLDVIEVLAAYPDELEKGAIISIDEVTARVHILPIKRGVGGSVDWDPPWGAPP